jgi:hypothetical protein
MQGECYKLNTPALFGDLEHIPFSKGHVEEIFIKLLEAVRFVRLVQSKISSSEEGSG